VNRSVDRDLLRGCYRRGIPPAPQTALRRAIQLAGDERISNDVLIEQIESEPQLRFGFMAGANLPMFCESHPIKTVHQGVGELGRRKTLSLFWLLALSGFLQSGKKLAGEASNRLWRHSLLTGILAHRLVRAVSFDGLFDKMGDALAAGLAHDIGHLLLQHPEPSLGIADDEEPSHDENDEFLEPKFSQAPERDHCLLGASLLEFWNAPQELVSCALHHHNPKAAEAGHRPLIVGVRLADMLAEHLDLDRPTQVLRFETTPAWQELAATEQWRQVANLHHIALEQLPDSLLTADHLARVLGG
jgi:HD-like signal output (HDOD) protein